MRELLPLSSPNQTQRLQRESEAGDDEEYRDHSSPAVEQADDGELQDPVVDWRSVAVDHAGLVGERVVVDEDYEGGAPAQAI